MRLPDVAHGAYARAGGLPETADFAGCTAAAARRRRYLEWKETGRARAGADLLPRLPLQDAVMLSALVGTGRMTWSEINAALDAMIKCAAADALDGRLEEHDAPPSGTQTAEDEIWARYHAQCDEVFADEYLPSDKADWTSDQLWRTERVLSRLREARDRELAAMHRHLGAQPSDSALSKIQMRQSQAALAETEVSPAEHAALDRLDATGFRGSAAMMAAIGSLVDESLAG